MALGASSDLIPNYKYGLEIDGVLVAGFTSCTGLEVSREVTELVEGGINDHVHVLPGPLQHGRITFKRGVTYTTFLWDWFHWGAHDVAVKRMPVTIYRYDVGGALASTWPIVDAYPVKWVGEPLQADGREAAVETLEIAFGGKLPSGGTVQRVAAEGATQPGAAGDAQGGGALAGSEVQRQLAQKVVELLKDAMRVERERAGKSGSY